MHWACEKNDLSSVQVWKIFGELFLLIPLQALLPHFPDLTIRDKENFTAMAVARQHDLKDITRELETYGI